LAVGWAAEYSIAASALSDLNQEWEKESGRLFEGSGSIKLDLFSRQELANVRLFAEAVYEP
jgi:hypothetical protein